ncbi:RHS domain-containing protein, partial [Pseudomonas amygdali]
RFLWQGLRMLREESPGQSSLYLYEPGSYAPLARVDEKEGEVENKVYYFHTDQIGTPLEMTDAEGQIVWQAKYRAWGAVEKLVVNEVEQNLRFQGQYFDVETGLHYNTFRYYDPEIGRFTTQDPIGFLGGFNLYQYSPSPIGWIDPWGWNCIPNKVAGMAREARAKELYGKRYGKENVLSERYLRNADGKIAKDPLTGEARRVDFVIKNSDGSGTAKEITSLTADKTGQLSKETRIREVGGTFVRDPKTKKLIEVRDVSTVVRAR